MPQRNVLVTVFHIESFHPHFVVIEQWVGNNKRLNASPIYWSIQRSNLFQGKGIELLGIPARKMSPCQELS